MTYLPSRRSALVAGAAFLGATAPITQLLAAPGAAPALAPGVAAWPTRTVKLMVGFPGGSSPDLVARTLAEPLSAALGQSVIVENRVGASGNIAAGVLSRATDDHTLGVLINGNMTIARLIQPKLDFDPLKDLAPISLIGTAPLALAVSNAAFAAAQGQDAPSFLAAARAQGDRWNYGSPGVGTVAHIGMELLKSKTSITPVHVPYSGNPKVVQALLSGEIQLALLPPAMAAAQEKAGKLHIVGVTSAGRSGLVPEYPSLAEGGVRDFHLEIWNALAGSRSLPPGIVARLSTLVAEIVRRPEVRSALFQQGWQMTGTSAAGLAQRIAADTRTLGAVIEANQIRAQ